MDGDCYLEGWSLTKTSESLLAVADRFHWLRTQMGGAWRTITAWKTLLPPNLHPPMPLTLLKAIVVTSLVLLRILVLTSLELLY